MPTFNDFSLHDQILKNLRLLGYKNPTDIQSQAIPFLLGGHDLLGIAQTGSGKTAAFTIPILQHLKNKSLKASKGKPKVLILSPTRELCSQIHSSVNTYGKDLELSSCSIYGGVEQQEQVAALRLGVEVVVATPGRLMDLMEQKQLSLSDIEIFVLDEADRMLDMGFIDDLDFIVKKLPSVRQTMLFSATMPPLIAKLAEKLLNNPKVVEVTPSGATVTTVEQKVIYCKRDHKFQLLKKILKDQEVELVLVFTRTKNIADNVVEYLAQNRIPSKALHGDKGQEERERALDHFKNRIIKVLVATDIASRGIDIEGVSHVINFDLPLEAESYVHRIGRTARAGRAGVAISFCDVSEAVYLERIQQLIQLYLPSEKFEGKNELVRLKTIGGKKVTAPTPGRSQEKSAYIDHSKRQRPKEDEATKKRVHPGFKKVKKKKR